MLVCTAPSGHEGATGAFRPVLAWAANRHELSTIASLRLGIDLLTNRMVLWLPRWSTPAGMRVMTRRTPPSRHASCRRRTIGSKRLSQLNAAQSRTEMRPVGDAEACPVWARQTMVCIAYPPYTSVQPRPSLPALPYDRAGSRTGSAEGASWHLLHTEIKRSVSRVGVAAGRQMGRQW
jgi:hypothetical protein